MRTKLIAVLSIAVGVGGAATLATLQNGKDARPQSPSAPAARKSQTAVQAGAIRCTFEEGGRLGFTLRFDSVVKSFTTTAGAAAASEAASSVRRDGMTSEMYFRALGRAPAPAGGDANQTPSWTIAGTFYQPTLTGPGHAENAQTNELQEPILFEMTETCRVLRVASANTKNGVSRTWFSTLKTLEMVIPADGSAKSWSTQQNDANGSYRASYTRGDAPDGTIVVDRERLGYAAPNAAATVPTISPKLVSGRARAEYRTGQPWFVAFHQSEHLQLMLGSKTLSDVVATTDASTRPIREDLGDFWTRDFHVGDLEWVTAPSNEEKHDDALPYADHEPIAGLEKRALTSVMTDFSKLLAKQPADYDSALNLLVQYLRIHPEAAAALIARMRSGEMDPFDRAVTFLAMQQTGGKAMHGVLKAAMSDRRLEPLNRLQAASALKDVPDPDRSVVDALMEAKRSRANDVADSDLKNVAALGLGGLAGSKRLPEGERRRIVDDLKRDLGKSAAPDDTRAALLALGNSGDKSQVETIKPFTTHASELARANAYRALSSLDSLPPQSALVDTYVSTPNGILKGVLNQAITDNKQPITESDIDKFIGMIPHYSGDANARAMLIRLIGPFASTMPRVKVALVHQYQIDSDPAIQELIGRFVTVRDLL